MRRGASFVTLVAVAVLLLASTSRAAPRVTIILKTPLSKSDSLFEAQLRAELLTAGFEVLTVPGRGTPTPDRLAGIARRTDSFAAIWVVRPPGQVAADVWVTDRVTGKALVRNVRPEKLGPDAAEIFALRAVELLRASLLELNPKHPSRGSMPARPREPVWAAPRRTAPSPLPPRRFWIDVGGALLAGPGGIPPALAPLLSLAWRPNSHWSISAHGFGPAISSLTRRSGSAHVDRELALLRLCYTLLTESAVGSELCAGLGAQRLAAKGTANPPYRSDSGSTWSALATGGVALRWAATRDFALRLGLDALATTPRAVLRFGSGDSTHASEPALLGSLEMEVGW